MTTSTIPEPAATEYAPYYEKYVSLVPRGDILTTLNEQLSHTLTLLRSIPESQGGARYAPEKWSIRQLIGHINDTERIFGYRALRFARNDKTELPGFEQDGYVTSAAFDDYSLSELAAEFEHIRQANLLLFKHLPEAAWRRTGIASGHPVSVRALAYIIVGHELHHIDILRTKYLQHHL